MKKIFCENCFNEMEIKEYDIGIYIVPCSCGVVKKKEMEHAHQRGYNEGYNEGYDAGYDAGVIRGK